MIGVDEFGCVYLLVLLDELQAQQEWDGVISPTSRTILSILEKLVEAEAPSSTQVQPSKDLFCLKLAKIGMM